MVERAVGGGGAEDREAGAVEELGEHVHRGHEIRIDAEAPRQGRRLEPVPLGDVGREPRGGGLEPAAKPDAAADRLHRAHDREHRVEAPPRLDGEQFAVRAADLLRRAVERHDPQPARPAQRAVLHRPLDWLGRRQRRSGQEDLERPAGAAGELPLDLLPRHGALRVARPVVDAGRLPRGLDGQLHHRTADAEREAAVSGACEPGVVAAPPAAGRRVVTHAEEPGGHRRQRRRRGLREQGQEEGGRGGGGHEPGEDARGRESIGGIPRRAGSRAAEVHDPVLRQRERRRVGAAADHGGVFLVRHLEVEGVGVESCQPQLHRLARGLVAARQPHAAADREGVLPGEAVPGGREVGGECGRGRRPGGRRRPGLLCACRREAGRDERDRRHEQPGASPGRRPDARIDVHDAHAIIVPAPTERA